MDKGLIAPGRERSAKPKALTVSKVVKILLETALESFVVAVVVLLCGSIITGFVGGLWQKMMPSPPPLFPGKPHQLETAALIKFVRQNGLALLFAMFFLAKGAVRLARYSHNEQHRKIAAWLKGIGYRISQQWLNLVVVNASIALFLTVTVQIAQQFSITHYLLGLLAHALHPVIQGIASVFPGSEPYGHIESVMAWYNANQFKFLFWFFYAAAICDDLGLPNLKSLWNWLLRRMGFRTRKPKQVAEDDERE